MVRRVRWRRLQPLPRVGAGEYRVPVRAELALAQDLGVPVEQVRDLAARAGQLGLPARLDTVPGLAHDSMHHSEDWDVLWPEITKLLGEEQWGRRLPIE